MLRPQVGISLMSWRSSRKAGVAGAFLASCGGVGGVERGMRLEMEPGPKHVELSSYDKEAPPAAPASLDGSCGML